MKQTFIYHEWLTKVHDTYHTIDWENSGYDEESRSQYSKVKRCIRSLVDSYEKYVAICMRQHKNRLRRLQKEHGHEFNNSTNPCDFDHPKITIKFTVDPDIYLVNCYMRLTNDDVALAEFPINKRLLKISGCILEEIFSHGVMTVALDLDQSLELTFIVRD